MTAAIRSIAPKTDTNTYAIEKNVPPPAFHGAPNRLKYPFKEMEVGDSFSVPPEDKDRVRSSASLAGMRLSRKFTLRRQDDGSFRVWRIS